MQRRVVITGLGLISPIGNSKEAFWQSLVEGRSGIRRLTRFDPTGYECQIGGEITDESYQDSIDIKRRRRMSRVTQQAVAAAQMALLDAELEPPSNPHAMGVILGTGAGAFKETLEQQSILLDRGVPWVNPNMALAGMVVNTLSSEVAVTAHAQGPSFTISGSCASAAYSISVAADMIKCGTLDVCLTGGAESVLSPLLLASLGRTQELSTRNEYPEGASRPFDQEHDGLVPSEGSCVLILEERSRAEQRGARIYAELLGYAIGCEAYDAFALEPTGESAAQVLHQALKQADIAPTQIDWINAHGSSCTNWDRKEARVLKRALGEAVPTIPISATKSVMGHTFGAAAAFQVASAVLAMERECLPPTINLGTPDPECRGLNHVRQASAQAVQTCLIDCFGYGGLSSFLLLRKNS